MKRALITIITNKIKKFIELTKTRGLLFAFSKAVARIKYKMRKFYKKLYLEFLRTFKSKNGLVIKKILNYKMYLDINDPGLSKELLLKKVREELQTKIWRKMLKPGMNVLECGANLGYYALMEASIVGNKGKIYAIEPIPENFKILKKNIKLNNYGNIIKAYNLAMSDKEGNSEIAVTKNSNFATMLLEKNIMSKWMSKKLKQQTKKIIKIKTMRMDNFLENKRDVDLIRMDIEGYEIKVIKGLINTIKKSRKPIKLFIELHPIILKEDKMISKFVKDLLNLNLKPLYLVSTDGTKLLNFNKNNLIKTICKEHAPGIFLEYKIQ